MVLLPGHSTAENELIFSASRPKVSNSTTRVLKNGLDPASNMINFPRLSETVVNEF